MTGFAFTGGSGDFAVARYNAGGILDTSFGTGGKVTTNFGGDDRGFSVALQDDGKIVVAGTKFAGGSGDFALARYNAAGSLDATFGTGGKVTTNFGGYDRGLSVAIQSDGMIVAAGTSPGGGSADFALARYNAIGALDTTFGTGGKVTTDFGGNDDVRSVTIQSNGKIVVVGNNGGGSPDFALARYLAAEPASPTPTPTPVPVVGWPGLLALAAGLAALVLLVGTRRARAGRTA